MMRYSSILSELIILIVESEPITRDSLIDILEAADANTQFEERSQEALAAFRTFIPDCILCNVTLIDGSGYALIEQLRQIEKDIGIVQTPAIAIFDSERIVNTPQAIESGFQATITKPWKSRDVIDTVLRMTGRNRARY